MLFRSQLLNEIDQRIARRAEVAPQPSTDIGQVAHAFAEPRIPFATKQIVQFLDRPLEGPVRVDAVRSHEIVRTAQEHRVVEHQQLRGEDGRLRRPDHPAHPIGDFLEFAQALRS